MGKKIDHHLLGHRQALSLQVATKLFKAPIRVLDGLDEDGDDLMIGGLPNLDVPDHPPVSLSTVEDRFGGEIDEVPLMTFAGQSQVTAEQPEK